MAKGKSTYVVVRSTHNNAIIKTTTINKSTHKPSDIAFKKYCKGARKRVPTTVKEAKKSS